MTLDDLAAPVSWSPLDVKEVQEIRQLIDAMVQHPELTGSRLRECLDDIIETAEQHRQYT